MKIIFEDTTMINGDNMSSSGIVTIWEAASWFCNADKNNITWVKLILLHKVLNQTDP